MEIVLPFDSITVLPRNWDTSWIQIYTYVCVCIYIYIINLFEFEDINSFECCTNKRKNLGKWFNMGTST